MPGFLSTTPLCKPSHWTRLIALYLSTYPSSVGLAKLFLPPRNPFHLKVYSDDKQLSINFKVTESWVVIWVNLGSRGGVGWGSYVLNNSLFLLPIPLPLSGLCNLKIHNCVFIRSSNVNTGLISNHSLPGLVMLMMLLSLGKAKPLMLGSHLNLRYDRHHCDTHSCALCVPFRKELAV